MQPTSPLWLSHHESALSDRCLVVRGRHVCRRCAVLYPAMLVVAALQLRGAIPTRVGVAVMWLAPLGVVAEWIAEHLGGVPYSARRQVATTAVASLSFGVALGRHIVDPFVAAATVPAVTYTVVCLAVWFAGRRRHGAVVDWEAEFEAAEAERDAALRRLAGAAGGPTAGPAQPAS